MMSCDVLNHRREAFLRSQQETAAAERERIRAEYHRELADAYVAALAREMQITPRQS